MKVFSIFPNLPELQQFDGVERTKVIRQWVREVDQPWSGYLLHVGFMLLVMIPITVFPSLLFHGLTSSRTREWLFAAIFPFAFILATVLYNHLILARRRDALKRVLQQRERAL